MKKIDDKKELFNFRKYQNAKKSRNMLIRFIVYSVVIVIILYLIMEKGETQNQNEVKEIEYFEIE